MQALLGGASCIGLIAETYTLGKDVKSYLHPSTEEQAQALETEKELQLVELRKELKTCLIGNRASALGGSSGIPSVCEETAEMLSLWGGYSDANRMAQAFQFTYQQISCKKCMYIKYLKQKHWSRQLNLN